MDHLRREKMKLIDPEAKSDFSYQFMLRILEHRESESRMKGARAGRLAAFKARGKVSAGEFQGLAGEEEEKDEVPEKRKQIKKRIKLELPSVRQQEKQVQAALLKKNLGDADESPRRKVNLSLKVSLAPLGKKAVPAALRVQDNPPDDPALLVIEPLLRVQEKDLARGQGRGPALLQGAPHQGMMTVCGKMTAREGRRSATSISKER